MSNILVLCHQGLGDHLICNAIYRNHSMKFKRVFLPVSLKYLSTIRKMLADIDNITFIPIYGNYVYRQQNILKRLFKSKKIELLELGRFNSNYLELDNFRLDEIFYKQGKLPLETRWSSFNYFRDEEKVHALLREFSSAIEQPYAFLHQDTSRNFLIDRRKISSNLVVVEPNPRLKYTIFDYSDLIEGATEVHCIESSFSIFADTLQVDNKKLFAHRYARPEAKTSFRHQVNYRNHWEILN